MNKLKSHIDNYAIEEIKQPIKNLLKDISKDINNHNIGGIITDDGSGRIPGLIFSNIINSIHKQKQLEDIKNYFIAMKNIDNNKDHETYFNTILDKFNTKKKILIVTDSIATGETLLALLIKLEEKDIKFMVTSIGRDENINDYSEYFYLKNYKKYIYYGMNNSPILDSTASDQGYNLPGVIKEYSSILYQALKNTQLNKDNKIFNRKEFLSGREDIKKISKEILEYYLKELI